MCNLNRVIAFHKERIAGEWFTKDVVDGPYPLWTFRIVAFYNNEFFDEKHVPEDGMIGRFGIDHFKKVAETMKDYSFFKEMWPSLKEEEFESVKTFIDRVAKEEKHVRFIFDSGVLWSH